MRIFSMFVTGSILSIVLLPGSVFGSEQVSAPENAYWIQRNTPVETESGAPVQGIQVQKSPEFYQHAEIAWVKLEEFWVIIEEGYAIMNQLYVTVDQVWLQRDNDWDNKEQYEIVISNGYEVISHLRARLNEAQKQAQQFVTGILTARDIAELQEVMKSIDTARQQLQEDLLEYNGLQAFVASKAQLIPAQ